MRDASLVRNLERGDDLRGPTLQSGQANEGLPGTLAPTPSVSASSALPPLYAKQLANQAFDIGGPYWLENVALGA